MAESFLDIVKEKVVVLDGAMGTSIQDQNLNPEDFGGERYHGCNENLVVTKPPAVEAVHAGFLEAGCDVIETDTFGGHPVVLAEYELADRAYILNLEAAKLAKKVARDLLREFGGFEIQDIGPVGKLVFGQHHRVAAEGIRFDHVAPCFEEPRMDRFDRRRLRDDEILVASMIPFPPEILGIEILILDGCPHRPVENDDLLLHDVEE